MAQKTIVEIYDDLSNEPIDTDIVPNPTISFAVDGVEYEIDLGAKNRDEFYAVLKRYTANARKVSGARRARKTEVRTGSSAGKLSKAELNKIRDWAKENGRQVSTRGRLSSELVEAYRQATA
ncbi:histone-like nucleoid-structuring protein Lsr2 [Nocardia stercoris]|uniref:Lsr2 family protein n=1 Tax=Nocardia stercoris TaxID=2483361 RepID=A0A3M2L9I7_9NOCA|nr:Lsr2 family protein [Nocardia stercoris]RMI32585.1 Lsr2 family protein [Nocardia stercoris]